MVTIRNVSKHYGDQHVLKGVSLDVPRGEVVCIIGPSGSGKTTLLRTLNHLETIDSGTIRIDGQLVGYRRDGNALRELSQKEISARREGIGMVFQHFNLFRHLSVLENVTLGPIEVRRVGLRDAVADATRLLAQVGLAGREDAYPVQLSGGQQQRVAIARALAMKPQLLLFDEPTSALDPELVGEVLAVLRELAHTGITMIVVTHEIRFARQVADRVVVMADGQIVEQGDPAAVLDTPASQRTQDFLSAVL